MDLILRYLFLIKIYYSLFYQKCIILLKMYYKSFIKNFINN